MKKRTATGVAVFLLAGLVFGKNTAVAKNSRVPVAVDVSVWYVAENIDAQTEKAASDLIAATERFLNRVVLRRSRHTIHLRVAFVKAAVIENPLLYSAFDARGKFIGTDDIALFSLMGELAEKHSAHLYVLVTPAYVANFEKETGRYERVGGVTNKIGGNFIIISRFLKVKDAPTILLHELGHAAGQPHITGAACNSAKPPIMCREIPKNATAFLFDRNYQKGLTKARARSR